MLTPSDLQQFYDFALAEINNGGVASLDECLLNWREYQDTVAAIREAEADIAAGRIIPLAQVEAELREEFGLPPRRSIR
jgi:hypothetical protein